MIQTKQQSIDTYGDLTNLTDETLGVSYNGTNFVFKIDEKSLIIGIEAFKTQYDLQSGETNILTTIDQIEAKIGIAKFKANHLERAKILLENEETNSIATFGNLTSETIEVDYETDYTFQINGKTVITGLAKLNTELNNQGDTEDDYTIDNLPSTLTIDITKTVAKAKAKAKEHSIATYGDLTSQVINVNYNGEINYTVNEQEINFEKLAEETLKQEITLTNGKNTEATLDATDLEGLDVDQLKKAKSIATYGDLINEIIEVDYNGTNYTFVVNRYATIENLSDLNVQLKLQGLTEDYTIDTLNLTFDETKTLAKAKLKATSFETYGDLRSQIIGVSYYETIKYTVNNQMPINFEKLAEEALKQGITLTSETELNNSILTNLDTNQLIYAKKKKESLTTYGNLTSGTIEVDYGTDYTFQIVGKTVIIGLENLNTELNNQGFYQNYTIDNLRNLIIDTTKTVAKAKAKAKETLKTNSIATYGDLTNLNSIVVDYVGTNYTFKVGSNSLITNLEAFKTELGNQGITTTTIDDIDDVVSIITGLTGTLDTANAKTKKTTTSTTSESDDVDQKPQLNNLFIIPIVLSVFVVIIAIGLILKKYFKNKKSK